MLLLWFYCLCWPLLELLGLLEPLGPLEPLEALVLGRRASRLAQAE